MQGSSFLRLEEKAFSHFSLEKSSKRASPPHAPPHGGDVTAHNHIVEKYQKQVEKLGTGEMHAGQNHEIVEKTDGMHNQNRRKNPLKLVGTMALEKEDAASQQGALRQA